MLPVGTAVGPCSNHPCSHTREAGKELAMASWALLLQAKSAARSMSLKPASLTEVDVSLPVLPGVAVGILDEG